MNIIAGTARGITLEAPSGLAVRPTAARARKALFDSLAPWEGLVVVDLFAGSGALGLEAASRGAAAVHLVESDRSHCAILERNRARVAKSGAAAEIQIVQGDAFSVASRLRGLAGAVDLVFADPPYDEAAAACATLLSDPGFAAWAAGARLVFELPPDRARKPLFSGNDLWNRARERKLGGTSFAFHTPRATAEPNQAGNGL